MNDNPDSHDFDWVTARDRCSVPKEFRKLMEFVEENYKRANDVCQTIILTAMIFVRKTAITSP